MVSTTMPLIVPVVIVIVPVIAMVPDRHDAIIDTIPVMLMPVGATMLLPVVLG
jgi:hypothetical protein